MSGGSRSETKENILAILRATYIQGNDVRKLSLQPFCNQYTLDQTHLDIIKTMKALKFAKIINTISKYD